MLDWGQGTKQLAARRHGPARAGSLVRTAGREILRDGAEHLQELPAAPVPGLYAVSSYIVARAPVEWVKAPPKAIVGHAIYIFDVPGVASARVP